MQVPWQDVYDQTRRDFFFILPEAMLACFGLATLLLDFFLTRKEKWWNSLTAMLGVAFSGAALLVMYKGMQGQAYAFGNSLIIDPFFIFFGFIFLSSTALSNSNFRQIHGNRKRAARRVLRSPAFRDGRHDVPSLWQ